MQKTDVRRVRGEASLLRADEEDGATGLHVVEVGGQNRHRVVGRQMFEQVRRQEGVERTARRRRSELLDGDGREPAASRLGDGSPIVVNAERPGTQMLQVAADAAPKIKGAPEVLAAKVPAVGPLYVQQPLPRSTPEGHQATRIARVPGVIHSHAGDLTGLTLDHRDLLECQMGRWAAEYRVDVRLMATTTTFGLLIVGGIVELLRRRRLREKYAGLWLITGFLVIVLAVFPCGLDRVAGLLGVASGVSLVLFLAIVFLLAIAMHLSWEVSQLEEETRSISEEIALLRIELGDVAQLRRRPETSAEERP